MNTSVERVPLHPANVEWLEHKYVLVTPAQWRFVKLVLAVFVTSFAVVTGFGAWQVARLAAAEAVGGTTAAEAKKEILALRRQAQLDAATIQSLRAAWENDPMTRLIALEDDRDFAFYVLAKKGNTGWHEPVTPERAWDSISVQRQARAKARYAPPR